MRIRHLFLTFLFLVTVALLGGCAGPAADSPERCYKDGQEALAAENFAEAAAAFEKAASHEDADRLLQYSRAWQALENADFPAAADGFRSLGSFKDCPLMLSYCLARQQEALAQTAFASDDADQAVPACAEAPQSAVYQIDGLDESRALRTGRCRL